MSAASAQSILVAAAADLAPAEKDLSAACRKRTGVAVRFVFGSSGSLSRQVAAGAPYDVYLSANEQYVEELRARGHLLEKTVRVYAFGRLALVSARGEARTLADLAQSRVVRVAIANPAHAPYGVAARQALKRGGLWDSLQPKIVYGENVRQALQFVESRNAEAGLVAWSLVIRSGGILLPESAHEPIRQAGGICARSGQQDAGVRFLDFLGSREGRNILHKYGFGTPGK